MSHNPNPKPPVSGEEQNTKEWIGPIEKSLEKHFEKMRILREEGNQALAEAEVALKLARR